MIIPQTARFQQRLQRLVGGTGNLGLAISPEIVPVILMDDVTKNPSFEDPVRKLYGAANSFVMTIGGISGIEIGFPGGADPGRRIRPIALLVYTENGAANRSADIRIVPGSTFSLTTGTTVTGTQLERPTGQPGSSAQIHSGQVAGMPGGNLIGKTPVITLLQTTSPNIQALDLSQVELQPTEVLAIYSKAHAIGEVVASMAWWQEYEALR